MIRSLPGLLGALGAAMALSACMYKESINDPVEGVTTGAGGKGSGGRSGTGGRPGSGGSAPAGGGTGGMGAAGSGTPAVSGGGAPGGDAQGAGGSSAADGGPPAAFTVSGVATWKGDATAAYSIVHEVLCDSSVVNGPFNVGDPELKKRNLRAGFGVIVGLCESGRHWEKVKTLVANGHDVFSHTLNHRCLTGNNNLASGCDRTVMRSTNYAMEIGNAASMLEQRTGVKPGFLLLPYDVCDPAAISEAQSRGYIGARCSQGMNSADFADPFKVAFDLWGPAWSKYGTMGNPCTGVTARMTRPNQAPAACRQHVLGKYVEDAIASKGWALRGFHGFDSDSGSFEPVSPGDYRTHLDFVVTKVNAGQLWVDGPGRVVRYRMARQHCPVPTIAGPVLSFGPASPECTKHATEVSYILTSAPGTDPAALSATQAGQKITGKKLGPGRFVIDIDPTKGQATLD